MYLTNVPIWTGWSSKSSNSITWFNSGVVHIIKPTSNSEDIYSINNTGICLSYGHTVPILCLESFKSECGKQRSISSMSSRRIKTCRCRMELTIDTKLNITYANESATLCEWNSILLANISALIRGLNKEWSGLEHYASCKVLFRCEKVILSHLFIFVRINILTVRPIWSTSYYINLLNSSLQLLSK